MSKVTSTIRITPSPAHPPARRSRPTGAARGSRVPSRDLHGIGGGLPGALCSGRNRGLQRSITPSEEAEPDSSPGYADSQGCALKPTCPAQALIPTSSQHLEGP